MSLSALKARLAELQAPKPEASGLGTGIEQLDALLPGRGIPRGRLTEVLGARGGGKTTFLRQLVEETAERKLWVAYIDAGRTLAPRDWAHVGGDGSGKEDDRGQLWMIRPRTPGKGAWCADVLLRSGAFELVVLDGAPPLTRAAAARLTRLAREANAALIVVGEDERSATMLAGALRLRVRRAPACFARVPRARALAITVEKGGNRRTVEVSYAVRVARRLCTHPEVPDRRGVARAAARTRGGGAGGGAAAAPATRSSTLPKKRRAAEAEWQRGRGHATG